MKKNKQESKALFNFAGYATLVFLSAHLLGLVSWWKVLIPFGVLFAWAIIEGLYESYFGAKKKKQKKEKQVITHDPGLYPPSGYNCRHHIQGIDIKDIFVDECVSKPSIPTGVQLIQLERRHQIEDNGYTTEYDMQYKQGTLVNAAVAILFETDCYWPPVMYIGAFHKIMSKPVKERISIAGAFLAAELDTLPLRGRDIINKSFLHYSESTNDEKEKSNLETDNKDYILGLMGLENKSNQNIPEMPNPEKWHSDFLNPIDSPQRRKLYLLDSVLDDCTNGKNIIDNKFYDNLRELVIRKDFVYNLNGWDGTKSIFHKKGSELSDRHIKWLYFNGSFEPDIKKADEEFMLKIISKMLDNEHEYTTELKNKVIGVLLFRDDLIYLFLNTNQLQERYQQKQCKPQQLPETAANVSKFECYEIHPVQSRIMGCDSQCKECAEKEALKKAEAETPAEKTGESEAPTVIPGEPIIVYKSYESVLSEPFNGQQCVFRFNHNGEEQMINHPKDIVAKTLLENMMDRINVNNYRIETLPTSLS